MSLLFAAAMGVAAKGEAAFAGVWRPPRSIGGHVGLL